MRTVELITTGGTIEKTYDEGTGKLFNKGSIVARMLRRLNLVDTEIRHRALMSKDSLHMTREDRERIVHAVREAMASADAVLVLHGTDTLHLSGERLLQAFAPAGPRVPIVLTGAMRPFEMKRSDALQNLTEALMASSLLPPGVYCVAHGRALAFPGVIKDKTRGTFTRAG